MRKIEIDITVECETRTMTEWAKLLKMDRHTFRMRYLRGLRGEALLAPLESRKKRPKNIVRTDVHIELESEIVADPQEDMPYPQRLLTHNNRTRTLKEWSKLTGIQLGTVIQRYKANKDAQQVLAKVEEISHVNQRMLTYKGETLNMTKWASRYAIPLSTALYRHKRFVLGKITVEEVLFGIKTDRISDIPENVYSTAIAHSITDYRLKQFRQIQADKRQAEEDKLQAYKDNVAWVKGEKSRRVEAPYGSRDANALNKFNESFVWQNTGSMDIDKKDVPDELLTLIDVFKAPKSYDDEDTSNY